MPHIMWDRNDYVEGMAGSSGLVPTGHSKGLRLTLKAARETQGLSAREVARRIHQHLVEIGDEDATEPHQNTIYAWESFARHPSVANFAAWARVLGYRLIVELDAAEGGRVPVLVRTAEAAEAARRIDMMKDDQRHSILTIIRSMSAG